MHHALKGYVASRAHQAVRVQFNCAAVRNPITQWYSHNKISRAAAGFRITFQTAPSYVTVSSEVRARDSQPPCASPGLLLLASLPSRRGMWRTVGSLSRRDRYLVETDGSHASLVVLMISGPLIPPASQSSVPTGLDDLSLWSARLPTADAQSSRQLQASSRYICQHNSRHDIHRLARGRRGSVIIRIQRPLRA